MGRKDYLCRAKAYHILFQGGAFRLLRGVPTMGVWGVRGRALQPQRFGRRLRPGSGNMEVGQGVNTRGLRPCGIRGRRTPKCMPLSERFTNLFLDSETGRN